jgi:hypothetical protein
VDRGVQLQRHRLAIRLASTRAILGMSTLAWPRLHQAGLDQALLAAFLRALRACSSSPLVDDHLAQHLGRLVWDRTGTSQGQPRCALASSGSPIVVSFVAASRVALSPVCLAIRSDLTSFALGDRDLTVSLAAGSSSRAIAASRHLLAQPVRAG